MMELMTQPITWVSVGSLLVLLQKMNMTVRIGLKQNGFSVEVSWGQKPDITSGDTTNLTLPEAEEASPPSQS